MVRLNIKLKGDRGGITHILYNRKMKYNEKKINPLSANLTIYFSIWVFFHNHSRITGLQGKGEGISLTPHYHFHPLHKHLDNSRAITAESSPLHIGSNQTLTGILRLPSASRQPLSYAPLIYYNEKTDNKQRGIIKGLKNCIWKTRVFFLKKRFFESFSG